MIGGGALATLTYIGLELNMDMKCIIIKLCMALFVAVGIGWVFNKKCSQVSLSDLTLDNIEALADNSESSDECDGCLRNLYVCRYYGDWGGCLGKAYIFEV